MFASLEVCTTSRSALADLLARMYFWTRPSLSRSLVGRHPCWTTACFLPCTRPPDIPRLRLRRPTRRPGPFARDARRAFPVTRSGAGVDLPGVGRRDMSDQEDTSTAQAARGGSSSRGPRARRARPAGGLRRGPPDPPPSPRMAARGHGRAGMDRRDVHVSIVATRMVPSQRGTPVARLARQQLEKLARFLKFLFHQINLKYLIKM